MNIPDYIERRIRREIPNNFHVVPGSTPVVSFGNVSLARVATLGLNPSRQEFLDSQGSELTGSSRRLATYSSLGTSDLINAPETVVRQVWDDCNTYFSRNPYRKWFDQLEPILKACGASYYDGSACHLDLVQLATDPTWAKLKPASARNELLLQDIPFLMEQLATERIELLLLNGMGVCRQIRRHVTDLWKIPRITGMPKNDTRLFCGELFGRVRIFGWSTNIQSSYGVTKELRLRISERAAEWASEPFDRSASSIEYAFHEAFKSFAVMIPSEVFTKRRRGKIVQVGWTIWYLFGADDKGEYMDYYAMHRMTNDRHIRLYADGTTEWLPTISGIRAASLDPVEDAQLKAKDDVENMAVARMLSDKGFLSDCE